MQTNSNEGWYSRCHSYVFDIFTYSTVRSATIKSTRVGIVYRIAQIVLLCYIIGYELIHNKGYQSSDFVSSVVTSKVKGQGFVPVDRMKDQTLNKSDPNYYQKLYTKDPSIKFRILDTADYIIPPNEYNSLFIMTNFIETLQTQGNCDEEYSKYKAKCQSDDDCVNLGLMNSWNGIPTGKCINSSIKPNVKVCEIYAWCPSEHDSDRRNILPNITNKVISQCLYDSVKYPYCPVFQLDYILKEAEPDQNEIYMMLIKGGVILIEIIWTCDFDFNDFCFPKFYFKRFDTKGSNTASGFNFRFANKFRMNNSDYRVLYKAYGLRFIINVSGKAGQFNIVPLMLTIGAGFGLMSISVIVADCVMLHCTKEKKLYQKMKELDQFELNKDGTKETLFDNQIETNNL